MLNEQRLTQLGLNRLQLAYVHEDRQENPNSLPARVTRASHDHYHVRLPEDSTERIARVRGRYFAGDEDIPVVGDWVMIQLNEGDHSSLPIHVTLPRRSSLKRSLGSRIEVMAANIDVMMLVTSYNQDFNPRRLERGLAIAAETGARALIVLNKADQVSESQAITMCEELKQRIPSTPILSLSALTGEGIEPLLDSVKQGETLAALGMSGVGKSTLINAMLGHAYMKTTAIREEDGRGRHTTTHRELMLTARGFWLMDTPGIRAFTTAGDEDDLAISFHDIEALSRRCRFTDCGHNQEPGCAILAALASGDLDADRWHNYLKLAKEAQFHALKHNKKFQSERRKEWARINHDFKRRPKKRGDHFG